MNVGELKKFLEQYPDDMPILYLACSDYSTLEPHEIGEVDAVDQGGYVMRTHPTMSADNKSRERKFLLFPGN